MSEEEKPPISLDELSPVVLGLAAERTLTGLIGRFLELVRNWAAPSAVVAVARDTQAESGWRLLPAVCAGSVPLGVERSLATIVQEVPECLNRPTVLRPKEDVPGVKPRDNWIVPWTFEGSSGLLLLRGVPRPYPPNLGPALVLASAPFWPRILGGPESRIEALVEELRGLSLRLQDETGRQLERLQAAQASDPRPTEGAGERVAALELELRAAREEAERALSQTRSEGERALTATQADADRALAAALAERDEARARAEQLAPRVAAAESERDQARTERDEALAARQRLEPKASALESEREGLRAERDQARNEREEARAAGETLRTQLAALAAERDEARAAAQDASPRLASVVAERDQARGEARQAAERLAAAEAERDTLRAELARQSAQAESLTAARSAADGTIEEHRRALEEAQAKARAGEETLVTAQRELASLRALGEPRELLERLALVETALETTRTERDRARSEVDRLSLRVEPLQTEHEASRGRLEELRRVSESAETRARTAEEALASVEGQLANARALREKAEARARDLSERWEGTVTALRVGLAAVRRAAFVPPGLRLSMEDASTHLEEPRSGRPSTWLHIALLDRDPAGLESLADELEAAGLDVRIANHPEELGLLLRTPGARELAAVVCDVMAFRPDQNVAGLFRSWDKDRPGLAYLLSYNSENTGEMDRARRVPQSLTIAHLSRPLAKARLVETMEMLARRRATQPQS